MFESRDISVSAQVNEIAFSAGVTKDLTIQHAEVVKFDRIFTNIGRGYNSLTGVFSCPTSGIYVFQVNVISLRVFVLLSKVCGHSLHPLRRLCHIYFVK